MFFTNQNSVVITGDGFAVYMIADVVNLDENQTPVVDPVGHQT